MTTPTGPGRDGSPPPLPAVVERVLTDFVASAQAAFGDDLVSAVLFGSAAEGRMRATSDVNLVLVLRTFTAAAAERLTGALRLAQAAVQLAPMLVLESEIPAAAEAFAAKFADIRRRRRVLLGPDPFTALVIPRAAEIARVRQVLLNLVLRSRASYAARSDREEHLARLVADTAGPLRTCAAAILELEGRPPSSPRAALELVAAEVGGGAYGEALARVSQARETGHLPSGLAAPALLQLMELAERLRTRVEALAGGAR
jgi:predicted nucleotidyltransferase